MDNINLIRLTQEQFISFFDYYNMLKHLKYGENGNLFVSCDMCDWGCDEGCNCDFVCDDGNDD